MTLGKSKLTDEQLAELLRERGFRRAAADVEQAATAERAVAARAGDGGYVFDPRGKMRRPTTYRDGHAVRRERVAGRSTSRDSAGGGGDDDE